MVYMMIIIWLVGFLFSLFINGVYAAMASQAHENVPTWKLWLYAAAWPIMWCVVAYRMVVGY